ncbi:MAG: type II toxin-antitoxin system HicA family toxin [Bacteroidetes bacterium]|nr:type II toxin-antitoxin system HicA family toxin [Bacteroidota bacterium]
MGRLKVLSGEEVCKILEKFGFEKASQKGSHIIMQKKNDNSTLTVPVPNHKELRFGTLKSIIRQSQIPSIQFEE